MRGVKCSDDGLCPNRSPGGPFLKRSANPCGKADSHRPVTSPLYDGCTDIVFPIHTSRAFARQVGLPGNILQGTATLAFAVREIINREAGGDPLDSQVRLLPFHRHGLSGDRDKGTTCRQKAGEGTNLHFIVLNQEGQKAISGGYAFLKKEKFATPFVRHPVGQ